MPPCKLLLLDQAAARQQAEVTLTTSDEPFAGSSPAGIAVQKLRAQIHARRGAPKSVCPCATAPATMRRRVVQQQKQQSQLPHAPPAAAIVAHGAASFLGASTSRGIGSSLHRDQEASHSGSAVTRPKAIRPATLFGLDAGGGNSCGGYDTSSGSGSDDGGDCLRSSGGASTSLQHTASHYEGLEGLLAMAERAKILQAGREAWEKLDGCKRTLSHLVHEVLILQLESKLAGMYDSLDGLLSSVGKRAPNLASIHQLLQRATAELGCMLEPARRRLELLGDALLRAAEWNAKQRQGRSGGSSDASTGYGGGRALVSGAVPPLDAEEKAFLGMVVVFMQSEERPALLHHGATCRELCALVAESRAPKDGMPRHTPIHVNEVADMAEQLPRQRLTQRLTWRQCAALLGPPAAGRQPHLELASLELQLEVQRHANGLPCVPAAGKGAGAVPAAWLECPGVAATLERMREVTIREVLLRHHGRRKQQAPGEGCVTPGTNDSRYRRLREALDAPCEGDAAIVSTVAAHALVPRWLVPLRSLGGNGCAGGAHAGGCSSCAAGSAASRCHEVPRCSTQLAHGAASPGSDARQSCGSADAPRERGHSSGSAGSSSSNHLHEGDDALEGSSSGSSGVHWGGRAFAAMRLRMLEVAAAGGRGVKAPEQVVPVAGAGAEAIAAAVRHVACTAVALPHWGSTDARRAMQLQAGHAAFVPIALQPPEALLPMPASKAQLHLDPHNPQPGTPACALLAFAGLASWGPTYHIHSQSGRAIVKVDDRISYETLVAQAVQQVAELGSVVLECGASNDEAVQAAVMAAAKVRSLLCGMGRDCVALAQLARNDIGHKRLMSVVASALKLLEHECVEAAGVAHHRGTLSSSSFDVTAFLEGRLLQAAVGLPVLLVLAECRPGRPTEILARPPPGVL